MRREGKTTIGDASALGGALRELGLEVLVLQSESGHLVDKLIEFLGRHVTADEFKPLSELQLYLTQPLLLLRTKLLQRQPRSWLNSEYAARFTIEQRGGTRIIPAA